MSTGPLTLLAALDFFATLYRGEHHIPNRLRDDGRGVWSVSHYAGTTGLSTFDADELTRLVFLAHDRSVRAWLTAGGPGRIRISIQARDAEVDSVSDGHPSVEEALEKFRSRDDVPWPREMAARAKTNGGSR